jgi:hypothetical protein
MGDALVVLFTDVMKEEFELGFVTMSFPDGVVDAEGGLTGEEFGLGALSKSLNVVLPGMEDGTVPRN